MFLLTRSLFPLQSLYFKIEVNNKCSVCDCYINDLNKIDYIYFYCDHIVCRNCIVKTDRCIKCEISFVNTFRYLIKKYHFPECGICTEEFDNMSIYDRLYFACGHCICRDCYNQKINFCPFCRLS